MLAPGAPTAISVPLAETATACPKPTPASLPAGAASTAFWRQPDEAEARTNTYTAPAVVPVCERSSKSPGWPTTTVFPSLDTPTETTELPFGRGTRLRTRVPGVGFAGWIATFDTAPAEAADTRIIASVTSTVGPADLRSSRYLTQSLHPQVNIPGATPVSRDNVQQFIRHAVDDAQP